MPSLTTMLLFMSAGAVLVALPGPNHVYIMTRSIAQGRSAGISSALGVESGTLVHIALAAAGLSALIASSRTAFDVVKYAGAAYLFYLAYKAVRRPAAPDTADAAGASDGLRRVYWDGVLVNVLNPKVALFFLAFLPQFLEPDHGPVAVQIVVLGLVLAAMGLASDLLYAVAAGVVGGWLRGRSQLGAAQRYGTAVIYAGLGAATALAGGRRN